jgi:SAM-dependent methyltransferase
MKFTGERYVPSEDGKIRLEHYHRYAIATSLVKDKKVLDIACGEGYGSFFIAKFAKDVVGVDVSHETITHANQQYKSHNLSFKQGSAIDLAFPDHSFDVVISFETVEHLAEQEQMISELRRVLKPEGCLIISSPNRPVYSEESGEHNEFHVKELDFNEFDALLKTQFPSIQYYGQRMLMGSAIHPLINNNNDTYDAWIDDGLEVKRGMSEVDDFVYFIAVCNQKGYEAMSFSPSIQFPKKLDLIKHYVSFAKWAKNQDLHVTQLQKVLADKNVELAKILKKNNYVHFLKNLFKKK